MSGCGRGHGRLVDVVVVTMVVAGLVDAVGVVAVTIALVDVVVVVVTVGCVAVAGCVVTIGFVAVAGGLLPIGFGAVAVVVVTIGLVEGDGLVRVVGGKGAGIEAVVVLGERVLVVAPLAVVVPAGVDAAAVIVGAVGLATVGAVAGSGWGETNLWGVSLRPVVVIRCVLFVAELAGAGLTRPAWRQRCGGTCARNQHAMAGRPRRAARSRVPALRRLGGVVADPRSATRAGGERPVLIVGVSVPCSVARVLSARDRLRVEPFIDRQPSTKSSKLLADAARREIERRPAQRAKAKRLAHSAGAQSGVAARAVEVLHGDATENPAGSDRHRIRPGRSIMWRRPSGSSRAFCRLVANHQHRGPLEALGRSGISARRRPVSALSTHRAVEPRFGAHRPERLAAAGARRRIEQHQ